VLISSIQNQPLVTQPQSETPPLNTFDEEALDKLREEMQEKFDALDTKIEQKTDLDNFNSELTQLKDAITSLESVKRVDPASHASHREDILDLTERMNEFYSIKNQIKDTQEKHEDCINKIVSDMTEKADKNDISCIYRLLKSSDIKTEGLVNHMDELQKEIDSMNQETGPDFEKMINALQKQVDRNYDVNSEMWVSERVHSNEKDIKHLAMLQDEVSKMTDKTDRNVIKLTQRVDVIQKKLDLLDGAFNGFMVPADIFGEKDTSAVDMLKESLSSLRREFFKYKDECSSNFSTIKEKFDKNADKLDLRDLKDKLTEMIEKNQKGMVKNKAELRRLIKDIDEKVGNYINDNIDQ
jgi:hypothetical protein